MRGFIVVNGEVSKLSCRSRRDHSVVVLNMIAALVLFVCARKYHLEAI